LHLLKNYHNSIKTNLIGSSRGVQKVFIYFRPN